MWLFALPALLINVCIILIPALLTLMMAFFAWDGVGIPSWAALANFQHMFGDPVFWSALTNNFIWTAIFLTVPVSIALLMAAALLMSPLSRAVVQPIIFLPRILAVAVSGRIFQGMIFSPVTGLVAWLNEHGFSIADPLADPDRSLYAVAAVDIWHWWGFLAVVFLAAMRQISIDQIEAARLDGAGFFALLRYVFVPGIRPTLTLMLILTVIYSFQVFEFIFIVTQGGPAYGSEVLATLAYRHAFFEGDVGQAASAASVMCLFGLCATAVYLWLQISDSDSANAT
jgi:raffinose/stachyose/melibiose transport system permease protein